jgi:hypothetical protein
VHRLELFDVRHLQCPIPNMPSWVPNWSVHPIVSPDRRGCFASGFSASLASYCSPSILEVLGVHCSTVRTVAPTTIKTIDDLFDLCRNVGLDRLRQEVYVTGLPLLDAYALALSHGSLKERFPHYGGLFTIKEFKELLVAEVNFCPRTKDQDDKCARILWLVRNYKFLFTLEGYVGFGPEETRPGK